MLFLGLTRPGGCGLPTTDRLASCFEAGNGKKQGGPTLDPSGYDAGKKLVGRKRYILTDTLSLLLGVIVHSADVQDRDGAVELLRRTRPLFPFVERIIGDAGYQGAKMAAAVA